MTAVYTWDVFSTLDGYGSYAEGADWGGYWGKQGPELLEHRAALFDTEQRMGFGATTFRENAEIMSSGIDPHTPDEWNVRTMCMHARRPPPGTRLPPHTPMTAAWTTLGLVNEPASERAKGRTTTTRRSRRRLSPR